MQESSEIKAFIPDATGHCRLFQHHIAWDVIVLLRYLNLPFSIENVDFFCQSLESTSLPKLFSGHHILERQNIAKHLFKALNQGSAQDEIFANFLIQKLGAVNLDKYAKSHDKLNTSTLHKMIHSLSNKTAEALNVFR